MDLERGGKSPKKYESASERQTPIKAYTGGTVLVPEANFIRHATMVRDHSILFAGQICHREADK